LIRYFAMMLGFYTDPNPCHVRPDTLPEAPLFYGKQFVNDCHSKKEGALRGAKRSCPANGTSQSRHLTATEQ
jgi:hypothetical protein